MRAWALFLFALVSCGIAACKPTSTASSSDGGSDASLVLARDGATLYQTLCAVCHGVDAKGYKADNAPSLVNPTFLESASDDQIRRSIVDGRPGTSMAAYGSERGGPLAPDDIGKIVAWIRSHGPAAKLLPAPNAGDAKRGEPLYSAHCERCHASPDHRGTAVHLANARFLEAAPDAFIAWAIRRGRPGTPMEAWEGKLSSTEIDDVVTYVRSFAKPNGAGALAAPTGTEPIVLNPQGGHPNFKPRSTPCVPNAPCTPDERFVSVADVKQAFEAKKRMVIIDARPPSDWMRQHIPGAVSIPYHDLKRLDEVPNDGTWVIAYCACPHHLSGDVVTALRARGVKHAVILDEGILEWHRRGYPIVTADGVDRPLPAPGVSGLVPPPPSTPRRDAGR